MPISNPDLWTLRRADNILTEYVRRGYRLETDDDLGVVRRLWGWSQMLLKAVGKLPDDVEIERLPAVEEPEQRPSNLLEFVRSGTKRSCCDRPLQSGFYCDVCMPEGL